MIRGQDPPASDSLFRGFQASNAQACDESDCIAEPWTAAAGLTWHVVVAFVQVSIVVPLYRQRTMARGMDVRTPQHAPLAVATSPSFRLPPAVVIGATGKQSGPVPAEAIGLPRGQQVLHVLEHDLCTSGTMRLRESSISRGTSGLAFSLMVRLHDVCITAIHKRRAEGSQRSD